LRSIIHKVVQVLFLAVGLILTGQAILTPLLMVMMMVLGDFLAMTSSTDNVRPSSTPSRWKIRHLTIAGIVLGLVDLAFCTGSLAIGKYWLDLDLGALRTLTVATLVLSGQAIFYVSRERHHLWSSMPGRWLIVSSLVDLTIVGVFVTRGILMTALPFPLFAGLFAAAVAFAFVLDGVKVALFRRLDIA
jgi:H+-transporting ATPase